MMDLKHLASVQEVNRKLPFADPIKQWPTDADSLVRVVFAPSSADFDIYAPTIKDLEVWAYVGDSMNSFLMDREDR